MGVILFFKSVSTNNLMSPAAAFLQHIPQWKELISVWIAAENHIIVHQFNVAPYKTKRMNGFPLELLFSGCPSLSKVICVIKQLY